MTRTLISLLLGLLPLCLSIAPSHAAALPVSRAQAKEYLLSQGLPAEDDLRSESLQMAAQRILEHTLLARAWDELGQTLDGGQQAQMDLVRQELAVRLCREARLKVEPVSETQVEDYGVLASWLYFPSHILVEDQATADSTLARVRRGSAFAQQARRFSKDPGSAVMGGALGPVQAGQTVMEFEEAMLHLKVGEISAPVRSPFGWHIIRLDSMQQVGAPPMDEAGRAALRETLERNARRRAELALQQWLEQKHGLKLFVKAATGVGVADSAVVASSKDTVLTRGQLNAMMASAFGGKGAPEVEGLGAEFARYWLEQDAWLREARRDGTWKGRELKELVDLRVRLFKSALFVNEELAKAYSPSEEDLENYLLAHPSEFLALRALNLWTFTFGTQSAADSARALSRREKLDPAMLADRLGQQIHPRQWQASEVQALPPHIRSALVDLDPLEWSEVLELPQGQAPSQWVFYSLIGRSMPFLGESPALRKAVDEQVRAAVITAEIARVVEQMRQRTGLDRVKWSN